MWWWLYMSKDISEGIRSLQCVSYDPRYIFSGDIIKKNYFISEAQIEKDVTLISKISSCIRIYQATRGLEAVPRIAAKHGITVIGGAWIEGKNKEDDDTEVSTIIRTAQKNHNVTAVFIGNEVMQFGRVPEERLIAYVEMAKNALDIPVGTSEQFMEWEKHPSLVNAVDIIGLHALPYWASVPEKEAIQWFLNEYESTEKLANGKKIFVSEVGWPSRGAQWGQAKPNLVNQADFIRGLSVVAREKNIQYNIFEAFDQPWKIYDEGRAGAHWGIFDSAGRFKFSFSGSVNNDKDWLFWALGTLGLFIIIGIFFIFRFFDIFPKGITFGLIVIALSLLSASLIIQTAISEYMIKRPFLWFFIVPTQLFLLYVVLLQMIEVVEVIGKRKLKNVEKKNNTEILGNPRVSIHIPCRNENPDTVIRAIQSLLSLSYENFEIIVVDNNTTDKLLWRPVEEFALHHAPHVHFFHLEGYPGFKAGALNFALLKTAPDATIIGVIDADYQVSSDWLEKTIGYFSDTDIAVVQSPQAHLFERSNAFGKYIHYEYDGFFKIGMVQRNERNAIIQHGTMTLIRKSVLEELHGWGEWSITEDAELGFRILSAGYTMQYVPIVLGVGEAARTFAAYKRQRFRWVYGAVCIMKKYWKGLLGIDTKLTREQIFYFNAGWIIWLVQGLYPIFVAFGIIGSAYIFWNERYFPPVQFLYPSLFYFVFATISIIMVYRERVTKNMYSIIMAMISGASLIPTVAKAIWEGLFIKGKSFVRTRMPEEDSISFPQLFKIFFKNAWVHIIVSFWLITSSALFIITHGIFNKDAFFWMCTLLVLSVPSISVIIVSYIDAFSRKREII